MVLEVPSSAPIDVAVEFGDQRAAHARQLAFVVEETGAIAHADQGAGGVEQVDEQQRDDDEQRGVLEHAREIELQEGRRQRRRHRDDALEMHEAEREPDQRHRQHADQRAAEDLARIQHHDQHEAGERQDRRPLLQVAERDQRHRMGDDDAGLLERDDAEEQSDAGRHRELQVLRDRR